MKPVRNPRPAGPRLESALSILAVMALLAVAGWTLFVRQGQPRAAADEADLMQLTPCDAQALQAMHLPPGYVLTKRDVAAAKHQCGWGG